MGGFGSGFPSWRTKKTTVEECWPLSADKLRRDGMLSDPPPGMVLQGSLTWQSTGTSGKEGSARYRVERGADRGLIFRLRYRILGEDVDQPIALERLPQSVGGGWRWWFRCPLVVDGTPCRRRCGKLWLPPGARYFGCRLCHRLTYASSQEAHRWDAMAAQLANSIGGGVGPGEVLKHLSGLGRMGRKRKRY